MIAMTALLISVLMTGCQTKAQSGNNAVNQPANKSALIAKQPEVKPAINDNQSETSKSNETSVGSLASPTEAYKAAYAARKNKDVKALKRVLSKDILEFFADMGNAEQQTLDEELKSLAEAPQAATDETRNEKITGDKATLEYQSEQGKWETMDFVKEGDEWKMTMPDAKSPTVTDTSKKHK